MSMKLIRIFLGMFIVQRRHTDVRHNRSDCYIIHSKMRVNIDITVAMKCQREY